MSIGSPQRTSSTPPRGHPGGTAASPGGTMPYDVADELRDTIERLHTERIRVLKERRIHLALLGLAISLPIHILLVLWLASVYLPGPVAASPLDVSFELGVMNDEELNESQEALDSLALSDSDAASAESAAALEATEPSVGLENLQSGAIEAAGGGPVGEGAPGGGSLGPGGGGGGGSFFGLGGRGTRFAYVVDISGSMSAGARMQVAMDELKRSIGALPDFASFAVFLYSNRAFVPQFQENYLRAMPSNISRVRRWIDEQSPMGGTDPGTAFEQVFALNPPPDMVFFLTDGEIPPQIPTYLASRNGAGGKRKIVVHCVAFSEDAGQDTLRRCARENEGTFRFVPVPGGP